MILGTRIVAARADPELAAAARRASAKIAQVLSGGTRSPDRIRSRQILQVVYRDLHERRSERPCAPSG